MAGAIQTTAGQPAPEVRQVTILKCDIVNSTAITGELDLEGQLNFERGFHDIVKALAHEFDADMERFEGDGAFLILGLSQPRENAAESALRLALKLVARVNAWDLIPSVTLQVRVGVASGPVAAIKHSDLHSIAGQTINRAQRLLQAAEPDYILLCEATHRRAGRYFTYQDLKQVEAKGFPEGIRAWRVTGVNDDVSRYWATRSHREILGRDAMRETIAGLWRNALLGQPRLAWLSGDAGIGKSRLAQDLLVLARDAKAVTLSLDCSPSTVNTPLFPVATLLRRRARMTSGMDPATAEAALDQLLRTLVPPAMVAEALSHLGPLVQLEVSVPAPEGAPAEVQERTIGILVGIVAGLLAESAGLLLCEDLHWADDSTLRLISRLCARLDDRRILVLATSRAAPPEVLREVPTLVELPLGPLDDETAHALVQELSEGSLSAADARSIVERCEGVPLLLEELTGATLEVAGDRGASKGVPLSLQLVVETRLVQNPDLAQAAKIASALGRDVHLPLLASLTATDAATADRLAEAGFFDLTAEAGERARFRHLMICEAVYETVLGQERRSIHSRVADALLGPFAAAPDATPELLAEHLRKAERFREAIDVRLQAAADTAARGAYVESEGHCAAGVGMAAQLAKSEPVDARALEFRLTVQQGVAQSGRLGYSSQVVENTYLRAHAICGSDAEAKELYPIIRGLAAINLLRGDLRAGYDLSFQGLSIAERSGDIAFVIDALALLSYTGFYYRPYRETLGWIERCLDLYRRNNGRELVYPMPHDAATSVLGILPTVRWMLGDPVGAAAAFEDCVRHAESIGNKFDLATMQCWFAGFRISQQRWTDCEEAADAAMLTGEEFATWRDLALISKAIAKAHRTRIPEDARTAIAALDAYEASGAVVSVTHYCVAIANACRKAGEMELARDVVERGLACAVRTEDARMTAELMIMQAAIEPDAAVKEATLRRALAQAEEFGSVAMVLLASASLVALSAGEEAALARETLDIFAGADPPSADWMRPRLAVLRDAARPVVRMAVA